MKSAYDLYIVGGFMKTVITVVGKDQVGIIADVAVLLKNNGCNIIDISQTVMRDLFTMIMLVEMEDAKLSIKELQDIMKEHAETKGLQIKVQAEEIFNAMHKI